MDSNISKLNLKEYNPTNWVDNLVEYPNRIELKPYLDKEGNHVNNLYMVNENEGEVYESGTPINGRIMNNIEKGILNNNQYLLASIQDIKTLQLQTSILQAVITGGVNGEVYMDNLESIDLKNLNRGIYDEKEKVIYCIDEKGERLELTGFGIALG